MKSSLKITVFLFILIGCSTIEPVAPRNNEEVITIDPASRNPSSADAQMISDVSNMSCLARQGSSQHTKTLQITHKGLKRAEKRIIDNLSASLIHSFGEATAKRLFGGVRIIYQNSMKTSNGGCLPGHQLVPGEVRMARRCPNGYQFPNGDAILVHELGHFVANKLNLYPQYNNKVPRRCRVSRYTTHMSSGAAISHRREEFAEVFAAYLTATDRLRSACPDAYHFMKRDVFNNSNYDCAAKR
jgi:hypothetical protein